MIYLLDTNACIGWLRDNRPTLVVRIQQHSADEIRLCSVVVGELIYGAHHSGDQYRAANLARVESLRGQFVSLPFDDAAAQEYGRLRAELMDRGEIIGPNDLMIAAIALANGLVLVSHNTGEFSRVAGLQVEDWQSA